MKFAIENRLKATVIAAAVLLLGGCSSVGSSSHSQVTLPPVQAVKTCIELNGMTIPAASIGLPTTGAKVTSTQLVPAAGSGAAAVVEYCKVLVEINPVDSNAPKIKF